LISCMSARWTKAPPLTLFLTSDRCLRFMEGKVLRKVSTSDMGRLLKQYGPNTSHIQEIMLCDTKLTTAEFINATMSSHSAEKNAQICIKTKVLTPRSYVTTLSKPINRNVNNIITLVLPTTRDQASSQRTACAGKPPRPAYRTRHPSNTR
jgi:hypothetical protein